MLEKIDIQDIIALAKQAGDAIMAVYQKDFEVEFKSDQSPLTEADKAAHIIIEQGLIALDQKMEQRYRYCLKRGEIYRMMLAKIGSISG